MRVRDRGTKEVEMAKMDKQDRIKRDQEYALKATEIRACLKFPKHLVRMHLERALSVVDTDRSYHQVQEELENALEIVRGYKHSESWLFVYTDGHEDTKRNEARDDRMAAR